MTIPIITRQSKGSRLSLAEMDANFTNLRNAVETALSGASSATASAASAADSASAALMYKGQAESAKSDAVSAKTAAESAASSAAADRVQTGLDRVDVTQKLSVAAQAADSALLSKQDAAASAVSASQSATSAANASRLSVGSVSTGVAGSQAEVTISGPAGGQSINLVIPRGDKGDKGDKGEAGSTGQSAYQAAVAAGFAGTQAQWLASLVGSKGDKGDNGNTGQSAYQAAVASGFAGTEAQWLASLVGPKGDKGDTGNTGQSAYQVAVANGFAGTEAQWLASLVGSSGATTIDGISGLQTALDSKISETQKGAANGVATLDSSGKVPSTQLPSYVDDVVEAANFAGLPATGESGKIYVAIDTNKTYRWGGSSYIEISASPGSTDSVAEGSANLYFTAQRVRDAVLTGLSTATNAAITATDTVLSALGKLQKQITDFIAQKGAASGLASLDSSGTLTSTQLPANVVKNDASNTFSVKQVFGAATNEKHSALPGTTIDLAVANYFTKTISGTTTFTVSNVPSSGTVPALILELTNGGSATVNFWSGMKWAGGTAPTLTAAGVDILGFYTLDGGTTWRGLVLAKDSK